MGKSLNRQTKGGAQAFLQTLKMCNQELCDLFCYMFIKPFRPGTIPSL